jgi:ankyrin repeat protein
LRTFPNLHKVFKKNIPTKFALFLQLRRVKQTHSWILEDSVFDKVTSSVSASTFTIIYATLLFKIDEIKKRWLSSTIPQYALHEASRAGSVDAVGYLLDLKAEPEEKDINGQTPMLYVAAEGHIDVVKLLLKHGADVNAENPDIYGNALNEACMRGQEELADVLLSKGANVNTQIETYGTALQAACCNGNIRVVSMLLAKGVDVNVQGGHYGTALQAACYEGNTTVVSMLLAKGADVNAQVGSLGSALNVARVRGYGEIEDILLSHGAKMQR